MASRTTSRFWGRIGPFPLHSITSLCKLRWGLRFSHPYWWIYRSPGIVRHANSYIGRLRLKCDGLRAEKIFRLSAKRTSPFKSAGASVQSSTGSRGVRISRSNAGYNMFRGSVKSTGYPLSSTFSPSPPRPCVTMCHHITTGLYRHFGESSCLYILGCPRKTKAGSSENLYLLEKCCITLILTKNCY